jgi:hypothetical protein
MPHAFAVPQPVVVAAQQPIGLPRNIPASP